MNKRHKHADVIIAWANGEIVQHRAHSEYEWLDNRFPSWCENSEYRIKPEPKPDIRARLWVDTVNKIHLTFVFDGETKVFKTVEYNDE